MNLNEAENLATNYFVGAASPVVAAYVLYKASKVKKSDISAALEEIKTVSVDAMHFIKENKLKSVFTFSAIGLLFAVGPLVDDAVNDYVFQEKATESIEKTLKEAGIPDIFVNATERVSKLLGVPTVSELDCVVIEGDASSQNCEEMHQVPK